MNEQQVAEAVAEWLDDLISELSIVRPYLTAQKTTLPDAMVEVAEKSITPTHPAFPFRQLEQIDLRVFELDISLMVETESGDPDAEADRIETEALRAFGAAIEAGLQDDATLGDSVPMASPFAVYDYRLPFVQYADGTRGRQMSVTMFVAEMVRSANG